VAGSLTGDGSGTNAVAFSAGITTLGSVHATADFTTGWIAEAGVLTGSTSTAGICAWSLAHYNI
jgi:hypothetical protein